MIERVLIATDFSECARRAADRGARLAARWRARLHLLHAVDTAATAGDAGEWARRGQLRLRQTLAAALERERERLSAVAECTSALLEAPLHRSLPALLGPMGSDLLVMGAQGAAGWSGVLLGSTVERVLGAQAAPVLVARGPAATVGYTRVALATDFSATSETAARFALRLFPDATHLLLHVSEPLFDGTLAFAGVEQSLIEDYQRRAAQQAMADLEALAQRLGGAAGRVVPALRSGRPSQQIAAVVDESGIDLMVVGAQGKSRIEAGLLGSVGRHLASDLPCDVLVVPPMPD